ncbi:hypothetical protein RW03080701_143 [Synechococcus phage S-RIM8]|uniref:2OG-Fe(II) oxygenase superfamily domain containing protein n=2 Tax=Neptunevirus srim18 TaxID=2734121 RepID=A0A1D7SAU4_9CAUD|nr:2OG-Fe(II) oxygenase [Synechococcus phage S-RIM8 A.HR1]YP_009783055.1 2OG-Fe(II) oxygenase [Synechococcus phage S-RIM8]AFB15416.1 hypothetical protein SWSG_00148 [Synechococcus phage S-RIM8 A.HR5]AFB17844.1 hypothetical protein SXEG_00050 [Synechococcus phage S-RIM8 A.HR3]AGH57902.1 hypothetical protein CPJG_00150 [Synechococcus phage KBS-M-1A]AFB17633.1 hypothetical protein SXDG_00205 [Synechococcus phage S-RIM8 A.HR1]AOO10293.1 hypothetical protein RW01021201_145 [Synechococcus phage S-R
MRESIWTHNVQQHHKLKKLVLKQIAEFGSNPFDKGADKICNTDYFLNKSPQEKPYAHTFFEYAYDMIDVIYNRYGISSLEITDIWFQQYVTGNTHAWHVHPQTSIGFIYFVELPDSDYSTQFYHVEQNAVIQPEVSEGQVLIFPGYYPHRSPLITSDCQKTIISGNISFNMTKSEVFDYE